MAIKFYAWTRARVRLLRCCYAANNVMSASQSRCCDVARTLTPPAPPGAGPRGVVNRPHLSPLGGRYGAERPATGASFLDQNLALNISATRRLCKTVGGRFINGSARCCAVSTARSRAAATTNLARSNQSLVLRALVAGAKSCTLVNVFMICPPSAGG